MNQETLKTQVDPFILKFCIKKQFKHNERKHNYFNSPT